MTPISRIFSAVQLPLMGIRFLCPICEKKIHVKDHLAGLRGFCPKCGARVNIPLESTRPSRKDRKERPARNGPTLAEGGEQSISKVLPRVGKLLSKSTTPPADPLADAPQMQWYVVPPTGTEPFGPADGPTMRQWIGEGRVAVNSLVWRQDWPEWKKAGVIWSQLVLAEADAQSLSAPPKPTASPQFAAPPVPSMSGGQVGSQLARDRGMRPGSVAAAVVAPALMPAASLPAPAAATAAMAPGLAPAQPSLPAGSAAHDEAVYYPPRSRTTYWISIGLLVVGLIAMSIILVYVLDENRRRHEHPTPAAAEPEPDAEPTPSASPP